VAYLTGHKGFYGLDLAVDARVLDPRPDTETLVDWALELLPDAAPGQPALRLADLGTGSGAIALALQHARPAAEVWAVDASTDALAVAQANAARLQLPVRFAHSHWLSALQGKFDAIISNPPYIRDDDPHMPALRHEPRQALTSGADGLQDIRHIVDTAPRYLGDGGWLLIEHGWDQAEDVRALLAQRGFAQVQSRKDLAGIERASGGQWASVK
jgi:release factor glutamine methyltransferase